MGESYDAIVIGSGPNGLGAAITLAQAGKSVLVREANTTLGGSCRSAELTQSGFVHDICSTVQALALASPFLRSLPLAQHGLELVHPKAPYAHPLDDGTAAVAYQSLEETGATLGPDAKAWEKMYRGATRDFAKLVPALLGPPSPPKHPIVLASFGLKAIRSARSLANSYFTGEHAKALFAGVAGHSILPLEWTATAAFGMVLGASAHAVGWPVAKGGSQKLTDAMVSYFRSLGGTIVADARVANIDELPPAKVILCDVTPRQLIKIAGHKLPEKYKHKLQDFKYGPGVWKVDWAMSDSIPWKAAGCRGAGTVHLGGTFDEIADAERAPWEGRYASKPYALVVQASVFDQTRAPAGKHTGWAYCHVPHGGTQDMTAAIENQVERFAPGFKQTILARSVMSPLDMERHNANLVGGDITGGANMLAQVFARPVLRANPYSTPVKGLYICSASTPPGGGVHGMCGHNAAKSVLRNELK